MSERPGVGADLERIPAYRSRPGDGSSSAHLISGRTRLAPSSPWKHLILVWSSGHEPEHGRRRAGAALVPHAADDDPAAVRGHLLQAGHVLDVDAMAVQEERVRLELLVDPGVDAERVDPESAEPPVVDQPLRRLDRDPREVEDAVRVRVEVRLRIVPALLPARP